MVQCLPTLFQAQTQHQKEHHRDGARARRLLCEALPDLEAGGVFVVVSDAAVLGRVALRGHIGGAAEGPADGHARGKIEFNLIS